MTDNRYELIKIEINECIIRWSKRLGLDDYIISPEFERGVCADCPDRASYTSVFWPYKDAKITFWLEKMANGYKTLDALVLHELVHILLAPMATHLDDSSDEQHEFVCENITRILLNAFKVPVLKGEK